MDLPFDALPEPLREVATARWRRCLEAAAERHVALAPPASLPRAFAASEFLATSAAAHPELLAELLDSGELERDLSLAHYLEVLTPLLETAEDETALMRVLRRFRRREMMRIAWREVCALAPEPTILAELSALAEACIALTLARLSQWQAERWGMPLDAEGRPMALVVLGMGKLGGRELNFSSDVDLIFAYPAEGEVQGGPRPLSHGEYFTRLAQRLVDVLQRPTETGFVFRVDTRLRPFGEAGQLVLSFDAMEEYYQTHGREWERYALIKARPVAGDRAAGEALLARLRPFVYRRYLDYGALQALRDMKALIEREAQRRKRRDDIKLGPGGIREVEFIVQLFQLVRGGREPRLQGPSLLATLQRLPELGLMPAYQARALREHYLFLRRVENALQAQEDRQTHRLPVDPLGRARLALALDRPDWATLEAEIRATMAAVRDAFEQVFRAPQTEDQDPRGAALRDLWHGLLDEDEARAQLRALGLRDPEALRAALQRFRESPRVRTLSARGRRRLDQLMPLLLAALAQVEDVDATWPRVLRLLEAIVRRTPYLDLLVEHPLVLSQLLRLCAASPWVAEELAAHPLLLDELVDPRRLTAPLGRAELEAELERLLAPVRDDEEEVMERLRQFKRAQVLRVAAADLLGHTPLPTVSDHLTAIAEVILAAALETARRHLLARHGRPLRRTEDGASREAGFAVIGYGKLGGIELGYGSDLDLVFLHEGGGGQSDGPRPIDNGLYFARLAQRLMHILTAFTPAGRLYEVDTRLRPSGAAGVLVSSVEAFARYQRESAWTWEHQALVRARPVAGDARVGEAFRQVRAAVLGRPRDPQRLREDVVAMRAKMAAALSRDDAEHFDLKQGRGGLVDIEFLVQFLVLRWAAEHPALLAWTDNLRLLETLAQEGLLAPAEAEDLARIYQAYRSRLHHLTLQKREARVPADAFAEARARVRALWARHLG